MLSRRELAELLITVFFVISCHAINQQQDRSNLPAFDVEGHRGCRGLMPENTIPAMLHALSLGVNTLEMDAMITRDSQVILSHDPFFNAAISSLPNGRSVDSLPEDSLRIFGMTYAETQRFDVGLRPYPAFPRQQKIAVTKPLLGAVIDSVEEYCQRTGRTPPFYNIETKITPATDNINHPDPETFVDLLMGIINNKSLSNRVIIQSFDYRSLRYLHRNYPQILTAALVEDTDHRSLAEQLKALGFTPSIYSPNWQLLSPELIAACHQRKIRVIPWTVNDKSRIDTLRQWGVDGIITDYPDLLQ